MHAWLFLSLFVFLAVDMLAFHRARRKVKDLAPLWVFVPGGGIVWWVSLLRR